MRPRDGIGCFVARACDGREAQHHLQTAEAEDQAPHGVEALEGQFDADQEKQEDHAQLGDVAEVFGIGNVEALQHGHGMDEVAQHVLAEQHAHHQEGHDGVDAQPEEQRHGKARHAEDDQEFLVVERSLCRHAAPPPCGAVWGRRAIM